MIRFILGIAFGVLAVIFIAQNTGVAEVSLLFWTVSVSRAVMYIILFTLGALVGLIGSGMRRRRIRKRDDEPAT